MYSSRRTVYTGGTFDLFHPGHVFLLKQCKDLAGGDGEVVVALNTDEFIEAYKGKRPVMNYEERATMLEACQYVARVVPNEGGADSKPTILKVKPKILAIGVDWAAKDYYAQMQFTQEWLDAQGITLVYLPHRAGLSSTNVKSRVKEK